MRPRKRSHHFPCILVIPGIHLNCQIVVHRLQLENEFSGRGVRPTLFKTCWRESMRMASALQGLTLKILTAGNPKLL